MTEYIQQISSTLFGENVWLATIFISIIPIIELKGAIPFSLSASIWGVKTLSLWQAFAAGLIGTSFIVFVLALVYIPLIKWLKSTKVLKRLGEKLECLINRRKRRVEGQFVKEKNAKKIFWLKILGVFLFVANPLPFTGVWTGTCLAIALGLNYWTACATVIGGNVVAGLLIVLMSHLFASSTLTLFYILLAVALFTVFLFLARGILTKGASALSEEEEGDLKKDGL